MPKHLPKAVIWDLDGTLSDDRARAHFVEVEQGKERDWQSYFDAIEADPPIAASMEVLRAMHGAGCRIVFLTSRPDHTRRMTERWLKANGLTEYDRLMMRPPHDFRPSGVFKAGEIVRLRREYQLVCAFEDRIDVADALRGAGIPVFLYGAGAEAAAEALESLDASQAELVERRHDRESRPSARNQTSRPSSASHPKHPHQNGKPPHPRLRSSSRRRTRDDGPRGRRG